MATLDLDSATDRVRSLVGDVSDMPLMTDAEIALAVSRWNGNEARAGASVLRMMARRVLLMPTSETLGPKSVTRTSQAEDFRAAAVELEMEAGGGAVMPWAGGLDPEERRTDGALGVVGPRMFRGQMRHRDGGEYDLRDLDDRR